MARLSDVFLAPASTELICATCAITEATWCVQPVIARYGCSSPSKGSWFLPPVWCHCCCACYPQEVWRPYLLAVLQWFALSTLEVLFSASSVLGVLLSCMSVSCDTQVKASHKSCIWHKHSVRNTSNKNQTIWFCFSSVSIQR